ncbi:MAG: ATP-binding protein [Candidatus Cloacimonadia bacterium]|jgi:signal transduction histidine kinase
MDNLSLIKKIDFLSQLEEEPLQAIANQFKKVTVKKGEVLFHENDPGDSFYILKSGSISLTKKINIEDEATGELIEFKPYDYFGELALIDDEPRSGTATAVKESVLLRISKNDFLNTCKDYPNVLFDLVRTMSKRLRETNAKYMEMLDSLIQEKKLAAIGTAASKIVHDIKTPITVIVLTAQLIENVFEDTAQFTDRIVKQVKVLDEMIKEILDFARGEKSDLILEEVSLEKFFNELLDDLNPIADAREISINLSNWVKQEVVMDVQKINRTIVNICKNAMEAIGNKPDGRIEISSKLEGDFVYITIKDNGPGIPEEILSKLFEPFATHGKKGGTGLGLAISQKVIEDHNGRIVAYNQPTGGACFEIFLPTTLKATI